MATRRDFVGRLQRKSKAEPKPGPAPADEAASAQQVIPVGDKRAEPKAGRPADPRRSKQESLRPEELSRLRKLVEEEQLLPFKKQEQPPDDSRQEPEQQDPPKPTPAAVRKDYNVSNIETILKDAMQIDGAIGVALVDYTSGMALGQAGGGALNMDVAGAGNTEVVRAKLRTMEALGLHERIEDILITLDTQYHIIRLLGDKSGMGLFLYLALNKSQANLALARHKLATLEATLEV